MAESKQNLLQLYRFCFLMLADARKAQEVFHATLREAAEHGRRRRAATRSALVFPRMRAGVVWKQASKVCRRKMSILNRGDFRLSAGADCKSLSRSNSPSGFRRHRIRNALRLLCFIWMSSDHDELLSVTELKPAGIVEDCLSNGRREFQAWLNATIPIANMTELTCRAINGCCFTARRFRRAR